MGNSLARCELLFKTYCPINVVSLRAVTEAREKGAKKLAAEQTEAKIRNTPAKKVGTPNQREG